MLRHAIALDKCHALVLRELIITNEIIHMKTLSLKGAKVFVFMFTAVILASTLAMAVLLFFDEHIFANLDEVARLYSSQKWLGLGGLSVAVMIVLVGRKLTSDEECSQFTRRALNYLGISALIVSISVLATSPFLQKGLYSVFLFANAVVSVLSVINTVQLMTQQKAKT